MARNLVSCYSQNLQDKRSPSWMLQTGKQPARRESLNASSALTLLSWAFFFSPRKLSVVLKNNILFLLCINMFQKVNLPSPGTGIIPSTPMAPLPLCWVNISVEIWPTMPRNVRTVQNHVSLIHQRDFGSCVCHQHFAMQKGKSSPNITWDFFAKYMYLFSTVCTSHEANIHNFLFSCLRTRSVFFCTVLLDNKNFTSSGRTRVQSRLQIGLLYPIFRA